LRKRKWAIFAFIMLIASIFISLESWRLLKANEKLKRYILNEFRPILGEQLHISKVHVSFGNIHIKGLNYPLPGNQSSVSIKDLRLGYNFFNLMVRGFDLQYISQDVLFDEPTFYIRAALDTMLVSPQGASSSRLAVMPQLHLESQLKGLEIFNHITLQKGSIVYSENDSSSITLVHSLQGGIFRNAGDSAFIHLDGAFLNSDDQNVKIIGRGSLKSNNLSTLEATFKNYDLRDGMPFVDKNMMDVQQGNVEGSVLIRKNPITNAYELSGSFSLIDGAAYLFDEKMSLSDFQSDFYLQQGSVFIEKASFDVNNSPATMSGAILNIRQPEFDIEIVADSSNSGGIARIFSPGTAKNIEGISKVRLFISGPADDIKMRARLFSPRLKVGKMQLRSFSTRLQYYKKQLFIARCTAALFHHELSLTGSVDFSSAQHAIQGDLSVRGSLDSYLTSLHMDSTMSIASQFDAKATGTLKDPLILGSLNLVKHSARMDTLALETVVSFYDKQLSIESIQSTNDFFVRGEFDWQTTPMNLSIKARKLENVLLSLWEIPKSKFLNDNLTFSMSADGIFDNLIIQSEINRLKAGGGTIPLIKADAVLDNKKNSFGLSGNFMLHPQSPASMSGNFDFSADDEDISLKRFTIGDNLSASFDAKLNEEQSISGEIEATSLDIGSLIGVVDSSFSGSANINISLLGALKAPSVDGYFNVMNARYRRMGPYDAFAYFGFDSTGFNLQKMLLNQGDATLLYAKGAYSSQYDSLDFSVKGAGFDADGIFAARSTEQSPISGKTFVDLHVGGELRKPQINGILAIKNGSVYKFPFDEMELKLGDAKTNSASQALPRLFFDKFRLTRFDNYEITGSGYFPFSRTDSLSIDVDGQGNFLLMLKDLSGYFQNPQGDCRITGRIRGTPLQPRLQAAHLQLRDASMDFRSVMPPIKNVAADIVLDVNDQFVRLDSLSGLMGGKKFRIYNKPIEQLVAAAPLRNMRIGDSDVHFGAFVLETPDGGVPLNIVGLMGPQDFALLDLLGKEAGEKFYFASTADAVTLRGRIDVHGGKVMYPFYEGGTPASQVREFLENLRWDLFVSPTSNTRFVRSFPGAIDEIYVDLKLDDDFGGLEFDGKITDETFRINGQVRATKGFLEYLDLTFRVDQVGVEFDRGSLIPITYGRAKTTVTDSLGIPSNIYLAMQTVDNTMDKKSVDDRVREEKGRARFDRIRFKLTSDNPNIGVSEAQIMASLGYSSNNIQNSALEAIGFGTDNLILRPLIRPVEKGLEKKLGFDYVRFSSQLTKNLILFNLNDNLALNNRLSLLQSTKVMVGKYLADRFFIQYTGQIESGVGYRYKSKDLGFHHTIGLEFQINPQLLMELEYDYDSLMLYNRDDKRIVVRHWFPF
jgi:hypothetical protein